MGAYIEMLPPDRPIFMLGQPIIRLVPSGGPGGELGDLERAVMGLAGRKGAPPPPPPSPPPAPEPLPSSVKMSRKTPGPSAMPFSAQAQIEASPTEGSSFVQLPAATQAVRVLPGGSGGWERGGWQPGQDVQMSPAASPWQSQASPAAQYQQAVPYDQYQQQQAAVAPGGGDDDEDAMGAVNGAFISPSDLGQDVDYALQAHLTAAASGATPDVSAEYFRPMDVPGLAPDREGPHTGREGVYPKKLRDMVEFDFMGSTLVAPSDLAGLGCCGEGDRMADVPPAVEARRLDDKCADIEKRIKEIVDSVVKAQGNPSLTIVQKRETARQARRQIHDLKRTSRECVRRLKHLVKAFRRQLKDANMEARASERVRLHETRDRLMSARNRADEPDLSGWLGRSWRAVANLWTGGASVQSIQSIQGSKKSKKG